MPLDVAQFLKTRPCLYHLTARSNLNLITASGLLRPAADLLAEAEQRHLLRERRRKSNVVSCQGQRVHIRDQAPLHAGNMALSDGWTFEDFVQHLNEHTFFWPGTADGPIDYGRRHFERYADEDNVVLVLRTDAVLAGQSGLEPRFCRFNSGSPRCTGGRRSPRGPSTFLLAKDFSGTPSNVIEVVFRGSVSLPANAWTTTSPNRFL